jgi:hypothetical protein
MSSQIPLEDLQLDLTGVAPQVWSSAVSTASDLKAALKQVHASQTLQVHSFMAARFLNCCKCLITEPLSSLFFQFGAILQSTTRIMFPLTKQCCLFHLLLQAAADALAGLPDGSPLDLAILHVSSMYGGPEVLRCIVPQLLESLPELQAVVGGSASGVIGVRRNR